MQLRAARKWLPRLIGVSIFVVVLASSDLNQVLNTLTRMDLFYLALTPVAFALIMLIKSWRWKFLLSGQGIDFSLREAFLAYTSSFYVGQVTPGRLGEFVRVFYLLEKGYSVGTSSVSLILDRLSDLGIVLVFGYLGMFGFLGAFQGSNVVLSGLGLGGLAIGLGLALRQTEVRHTVHRMTARFLIPKRYQATFDIVWNDFALGVRRIMANKRIVVQIIVLTVLSWLLYSVLMYVLAHSVQIDIPLWFVVICVSVTALVVMIPISIFGVGTRDATLILLFSSQGLGREWAISFSFLFLLVVVANLLVGLPAWLRKPIKIYRGILSAAENPECLTEG